jgi:hypothetical protein
MKRPLTLAYAILWTGAALLFAAAAWLRWRISHGG